MFEGMGNHAAIPSRWIGYLSWALVGIASAAMLFGVMPTSQGLEAATVAFLAIVGLRFVARLEGRSE